MSQLPQLNVTIQSGPQAGQVFQVGSGSALIGRAADNQIYLADPAVSKQHARITRQPQGFCIEDLGSANGTFVNGRRIISPVLLRPGDRVQIGTTVILSIGPVGGAPAGRGVTLVALIALAAVLVLAILALAAWLMTRTPPAPAPAVAPATVQSAPEQPAQPEPTPAPEMVVSFTGDRTTLKLGECMTLHWQVLYGQEVRLDGESIPAEGSRKVCPQEASHTYRLTALSLAGRVAEQTLVLTVLPTPPPPPGVSLEFEAGRTSLPYGECTTLRWRVQNAQEVRLDGAKVAAAGTQQVCPTEPATTYRLLVQPLQGQNVEQVLIINVPATPVPTAAPTATSRPLAQAPVIDKFIADQNSLNAGSCTTLRWTVRNAGTVRLDGSQVANEGSQRVCPAASTNTYTLVATGSGGSVQSSLTLGVNAPPPTPVIVVVTAPAPIAPPPAESVSVRVCAANAAGSCYIFRWDVRGVREIYFDGRGVTGQGSQKLCAGDDAEGVLRIVYTDGGVEEISEWPPCR